MKSYTITTPPAVEPAMLAEFLIYARVYSGAEDSLCTMLIAAGREYVENLTGRAQINQTWKMTAPSWWENSARFQNLTSLYGIPLPVGTGGNGASNNGFWPAYDTPPLNGDVNAITLDRSPLSSVTSVKYYPADGSSQVTMTAGTDYVVDTANTPGRITPAIGTSWPALVARPDAVQVVFVAGYGAASSSVPNALRLATMAIATHFYNERSIITETRSVESIPHTLDAILAQYRVRGQLA